MRCRNARVLRPSLPPLAWLVVATWTGIAVAEAVLWAHLSGQLVHGP